MNTEREIRENGHTFIISINENERPTSIKCITDPGIDYFLRNIDLNVDDSLLRRELYNAIKTNKKYHY